MSRFDFVRSRLVAPPPPVAAIIPLALPFVIVPTLLGFAVDRVVTGTAFAAYYPFVLIAALLFGWRTAAVVVAASAIASNYFFMAPRYELFAGPHDTLGATFFAVSSGLIIALAQTLRNTMVEVQTGAEREADLNDKLQHLNSELQHRVKNTLAVVQGLAAQTFRGSPADDSAVRTFEGRLHALAQAQDVLTSGRWESCELPDLALRALGPFSEHGALKINGPTCTLPEAACVPLVLALHELGTNAVKYGALSSLSGSVDVVWTSVETPSGRREVVLNWTEMGGPKVAPPTRKGLGSRLLKPQHGLDEVALEFLPDGVQCRIVTGQSA